MAAYLGKLTAAPAENMPPAETLPLYLDTYMIWGVFVIAGAGLLLVFLVPKLRTWMHGIH